jgi:hypothetical protein
MPPAFASVVEGYMHPTNRTSEYGINGFTSRTDNQYPFPSILDLYTSRKRRALRQLASSEIERGIISWTYENFVRCLL